MWGRAVYDNIRKFLQFQLTVNVVALLLVFIGAVAGFGQPLNAVMMLWVSQSNFACDALLSGVTLLATPPPLKDLISRHTLSFSGKFDHGHHGRSGSRHRGTHHSSATQEAVQAHC
jgi:hypothetical protein